MSINYYICCTHNKFTYCFLGTNYTARKFNLLLFIPYKGTYLKLLRRIHTHYIAEVISSYLLSAPNLLRTADFVT